MRHGERADSTESEPDVRGLSKALAEDFGEDASEIEAAAEDFWIESPEEAQRETAENTE